MTKIISVGILAYNRPDLLRKTIDSILASNNSDQFRLYLFLNSWCCKDVAEDYAKYFSKIIISARNEGLSYPWGLLYKTIMEYNYHFEDPSPYLISFTQDDMSFHHEWAEQSIKAFEENEDLAILTCHHTPHHKKKEIRKLSNEYPLFIKDTLQGTNMIAKPETWDKLLPIEVKDHHNNEDWWIVRDSPNAPSKKGAKYGCLPGMATHIGWNRSSWQLTCIEYRDQLKEVF